MLLSSMYNIFNLSAIHVKILFKYFRKISSVHSFRIVNIQISRMEFFFNSDELTLQSIFFKYAFNK